MENATSPLKAGLRIDHACPSVIIGVGYGVDVRWANSPAPFPGWHP